MEQLVVIGKDKNDALSMAFQLGINSNLIKPIWRFHYPDYTGLKDMLIIRTTASNPYYVKIKDTLIKRNGLDIGTKSDIDKVLECIRNYLIEINSLYAHMLLPQNTKDAADKISEYLIQLGFTKERSFEYQIGRDPRLGNFYIVGISDRMKVIVEIFKGYIRNLPKAAPWEGPTII